MIMRHLTCGAHLLLTAGIIGSCLAPARAAEEKPRPTPEEAYRAFDKGMRSDKKEDRLKALEAIQPTKKDLEVLFPKEADKISKLYAEHLKAMREHCDDIAKEATMLGAIRKFRLTDLRQDEKAGERYKAVFSMMPKDIPVMDLYVFQENGGFSQDPFLFVNGHWISIPSLDVIPKLLEKEK
jgi:hypothetical protein